MSDEIYDKQHPVLVWKNPTVLNGGELVGTPTPIPILNQQEEEVVVVQNLGAPGRPLLRVSKYEVVRLGENDIVRLFRRLVRNELLEKILKAKVTDK